MAVPKYPFPVVGGLERQSHELAKALVRRGHTVEALSTRFDSGQYDEQVLDGVVVHRVPWLEYGPMRFVQSPFSLSAVLLKLSRHVDIVHVHNISWFGAFVTLTAQGLGLPVVTKLPNIGDFGVPAMWGGPFGKLRIALLKRSDLIVAMTPESLAELSDISFPASRVLKIPNGIPMCQLKDSAGVAGGSESVVAVFAGRLTAQKGLKDLLHAWALVTARSPIPAVLRLVGEGPEEADLLALAAALGIQHTVQFAGYSRDVPQELARADLFVLPSYAEGNSNAILEAMRAGLPIIATRIAGAPIQVGAGGHRLLFSPGDRETLAERLLELISDPPLRLRFGAAMRERVERLFSIERVAAAYEEGYKALLSGRRDEAGLINRDLFDQEVRQPECAE